MGDLPEDPDDEAERGPFALATIPRRVAAYLADVVVLAAGIAVTQWAIRWLFLGPGRPEWTRDGVLLETFVLGTISLPVWLYFACLESGDRQASLGKRLFGLKVTGLDGERLSFKDALLRAFLKLVPWEMTHVALLVPTPVWDSPNDALVRPLFMLSTFLVGSWLVTAMLTPNNQAPHDLIMKTVVVPDGRPPAR